MTWLFLMGLIGVFLAYDLTIGWRFYRYSMLFEPGIGAFLRWWVGESVGKLSMVAGLAVVITLAFLLQDYSLDLPDIPPWVMLPPVVRWGFVATLVLASVVGLDLLIAWWSYKGQKGWSDSEVGFFDWWVSKRGTEFCVAGVVICTAVVGIGAAKRYDLLGLKDETALLRTPEDLKLNDELLSEAGKSTVAAKSARREARLKQLADAPEKLTPGQKENMGKALRAGKFSPSEQLQVERILGSSGSSAPSPMPSSPMGGSGNASPPFSGGNTLSTPFSGGGGIGGR